MPEYIPARAARSVWRSASGQVEVRALSSLDGEALRTDGVHTLIRRLDGSVVEVHADNVRKRKATPSGGTGRSGKKATMICAELLALVKG